VLFDTRQNIWRVSKKILGKEPFVDKMFVECKMVLSEHESGSVSTHADCDSYK
jgi:hypothetical protein